MTKERIRIVMAEACGFVCVNPLHQNISQLSFFNGETECGFETLPNYPDDLNAVHEAEKTLDINSLSRYADELEKVCVPVHICPLTHWQSVVMATALQRCEAFIRTVCPKKWEED